jgi:hypothetical protein
MPFGIRSPSEYIEKHRALMLAQSTGSCHCCSKEVVLGDDNHYKLVPARFEYLIEGEHHERRALLCSSCYMKQRSLKFNTLEELIEHLSTRQRLPRTVKGPYKKKPKAEGSPRVVRRATASLKDLDREFLVDLHRMLGEFLEHGESVLDANDEMAEFLDTPPDEDDLLAGMSDEQRARMDEAVAIAAARTTEVPQENWGKDDVPNGW